MHIHICVCTYSWYFYSVLLFLLLQLFLDHLVKKTLNILRATFDNLALNTAHGKVILQFGAYIFLTTSMAKNNNARIKSLNHNKDFLLTYDNNFRGMRLFDI